MNDTVRLIHGDCTEVLPTLPAASVDAVITDPPYPCIKRSYGYWTETEWFAMMRKVVPECMRVLKPTGSAVFILQPNSEKDGRLRTWLWRFLLWVGEEYGIIQDAWWWNTCAVPAGNGIRRTVGLLRPSLKMCVWIGSPYCWRNQDAVLWQESQENATHRASARALVKIHASGHMMNSKNARHACVERGGTTPFNVIPVGSNYANGATEGHGASTPIPLCRWWVRYICSPSSTVLDPFAGSGSTLIAALLEGRKAIGIEREADYVKMAQKRLDAELAKHPLFSEMKS